MDVGQYRCVKCHRSLSLERDQLICSGCGNSYELLNNNVPVFLATEKLYRKFSIGVATQLFEAPVLYDWLVRLKTLIAPDKPLGIRDITDGHSLLNIGCGSNVEAAHLEYDIHALAKFSAVDLSEPFILAAQRSCSRKDADFCVASIQNLPYADSSFDVVIIPFVLHHLPFPLSEALNEAMRVSKKYVVVFDHIKSSESLIMRILQEIYWKVLDGGHQYLNEAEWKAVLEGLSIPRLVRTGAIGNHVYKFMIKKQN